MHRSTHYNNRSEQLLTTPATIFSSIISDVQHARRSIDAEFYIFASDRTGRAFAELLRRKSRQGVRVRLLVDGFGSRHLSRAMSLQLQRDGVDLRFYSNMGHCRNHRKMAIIDGAIAYVGGVNIADRYVVGNKLGIWYDAELRFTGTEVETLGAIFEHDYNLADGVMGDVSVAVGRGLTIYHTECGGGGAMERLFADVVRGAEHEVIFTTPYFIPPEDGLELLHDAVQRGVRVCVVVPERCDIWAIDEVIHHSVSRAVSLGVEVFVCRHSFVHAKLAVVDRRRVVVGSANLDVRSFRLNRELMVSTLHRGVATSAVAFVERLMRLSTPPTRRELRAHIPRFVARLFSSLL